MNIVIDVEKTLWNDQRKLSFESEKILKDLSQQHSVTLMSMESISGLQKSFGTLNVDWISTLENAYFHQGQLQTFPLDSSSVETILNTFEPQIYTAYTIWEEQTVIYHYKERLKTFYPTKRLKVVDSFAEPILFLIVVLSNSVVDRWMKTCPFAVKILAADQKRTLLHITKKSSTKEDWFLRLNFQNQTTLGIADAYSDKDFLKHCTYPVAMSNGDAKLKELCHFVTEDDNNHSGAMRFISKFLSHRPSEEDTSHC